MGEKPDLRKLFPREKQIMEIVYRSGRATANEVLAELPDRLANATVRTLLNTLEEKGYLEHETIKGKFYYFPTIPLERAGKSLLDNVLDNFFRDQEEKAVLTILKRAEIDLSEDEIETIQRMIEKAKEEGQ